MKKFLFCLCLSALFPSETIADADLPLQTSLIQLVASPEKYAGKRVSVIGFLWLSREQDALFLGAEDFRHGIVDNSIGLRMSSEVRKKATTHGAAYVVVVGTFEVSRQGLLSGFQTGLIDVRVVRPWSTLSHPRFASEMPINQCSQPEN
jgi:hypothetical protein